MIRWPSPAAPLDSAEHFGLALLVDLARLVPMEDASADVVQLVITDRTADLGSLVAGGWGIEPGSGEVRIPRAALALVTEVAGAAAEQRSPARDRHDRVPSSENPLVAAGLERDPVVSRGARTLRDAVLRAAGRRVVRFVPPWPNGRRWAAAFTHDLDVVQWWPLFAGARAAELARKGEVRQLLGAAGAALRMLAGDPVLEGVRRLVELERELSIAATWFVLSGTPTGRTIAAGDLTYAPESPRARAALATISAGGHEIGLHGSFATMQSAETFRSQRERLSVVVGRESRGVRQHFLRMRPGETQRAMLEAGFNYDATYGFPDRNGFRLGVSDIVPSWDAEGKRATTLDQAPLVWMDRALSKYRGIEDPMAWVEDALELAGTCRELEGLWVGLWHPNLSPALGYPGAPVAFEHLARTIRGWEPYMAPLDQISAWRAARRGVRAERIAPDGRVVARPSAESFDSGRSSAPIVLEDSTGRPMETVPR